MARISKSQVHAALDIAAQHILNARGDDNVISRLDIRQKLRELSGTERNLVDMLYRFIDKRDYKPGARVTKTDVEDTLAYTKVKLINAYDENNNGFSRAEIEKMSTTGKLAVSFARELKARENETTLLQELRILGEGLYF
ncbi:MAG: nuclease, partial [Bacteroidota bacterium]